MKSEFSKLWILVKVESGIPMAVELFQNKVDAKKREKSVRKKMNTEKDETGLFNVNLYS